MIDPKGYTQFPVQRVPTLLRYEGTEVFLFLPVPEMYRFVGSVDEEHPLGQILTWLWGARRPTFATQKSFADPLVRQLRMAFGEGVYTTPIYLAKSPTDRYVLVHSTRSLLGLERMVGAIWKVDPERGEGFGPGSGQGDLFVKAHDFNAELMAYVAGTPEGRTNKEVSVFTLTRAIPTRKADEVLRSQRRAGRIEVVDEEKGTPVRAFYLPFKSQKDHRVVIRVRRS